MKRTAIFLLFSIAVVLLGGLMAVGWLMQILYRGKIHDDEAEGNCWSYAVPRWLKDPRGTYLVMRLSLSNAWPHVFFVKNIQGLAVEEYHPVHRIPGWKSWFAAVWYQGRVRKGQGEE